MLELQSPAADSRLPRYQQLRDAFLALIANGVWRPDVALPPEDQLAERYGVAVGTVRKAIDGLVAGGQLERQQGRGTFVRRGYFSTTLARFFRMVTPEGLPIQPKSEMKSIVEEPASAHVAARLRLDGGAPVIAMRRLRLVGEKPILAEEIWVSGAIFAPLLAIRPTDFGDLLYPLYERACGVVISHARETIRFGHAPRSVRDFLTDRDEATVAIIERTAFGFDQNPLEFRLSYGPAEQFSYTIDIR